MTAVLEPPQQTTPELLWIDLTRKCQFACGHCLNSSGPRGGHGHMSRAEWIGVVDQAKAAGVEEVRFIGGEPTLHPDAAALAGYALDIGLSIEVFSNLVHVAAQWWTLLCRPRAALAASYYSDDPAEHDAITGRRSHARTRANIGRALEYGIPLRVGIVALHDGQRVHQAKAELEAMGVTGVRITPVRPFGRAAHGQEPDAARLCGRCGSGTASIGPDGQVSPCVFSTWMAVGDVHDTALADILRSTAMAQAGAAIRAAHEPEEDDSNGGADDDECSPGHPGSGCNPRT